MRLRRGVCEGDPESSRNPGVGQGPSEQRHTDHSIGDVVHVGKDHRPRRLIGVAVRLLLDLLHAHDVLDVHTAVDEQVLDLVHRRPLREVVHVQCGRRVGDSLEVDGHEIVAAKSVQNFEIGPGEVLRVAVVDAADLDRHPDLAEPREGDDELLALDHCVVEVVACDHGHRGRRELDERHVDLVRQDFHSLDVAVKTKQMEQSARLSDLKGHVADQ